MLYFKLKSTVLFRDYESFGYITDNRNYGYLNNAYVVGDRIVSRSGAIFLSVLSREPQELGQLAMLISKKITGVDIEIIRDDAGIFYRELENEGFVVSGGGVCECDGNDTQFTYKSKQTIVHMHRPNIEANKRLGTQDFFYNFFHGIPQLTNMHVEITNRCNEKCVHCYIPKNLKPIDIDPQLFYGLVDQCREMNLLHLTISGGEPMQHEHFCSFLKKCKELDFSVNVLSNLTLLDKNVIDEMKQNPLLGVQTSLYAMDPVVHDGITGVYGSFNKTKSAILLLIDNDIPVQVSCPIIKQNKNSYRDVAVWAKQNKIDIVSDFMILGSANNSMENLCCRLDIEEIESVINMLVDNDPLYIGRMKNHDHYKKGRDLSEKVCPVCSSSLCITESGDVYPCVGWRNSVLGNIKEASIKTIVNCSKEVKFLSSLCMRDFQKCIDCIDKEYCTICLVRNANDNPSGDPLIVSEYFCEIAKLNRKIVKERESM